MSLVLVEEVSSRLSLTLRCCLVNTYQLPTTLTLFPRIPNLYQLRTFQDGYGDWV
jgi:hypothetical protein